MTNDKVTFPRPTGNSGKIIESTEFIERNAEILFLGALQQTTVKPGDMFVLTLATEIKSDGVARILEAWKGIMPNNSLIVLRRGEKLEVISPGFKREE